MTHQYQNTKVYVAHLKQNFMELLIAIHAVYTEIYKQIKLLIVPVTGQICDLLVLTRLTGI